MAEQVFAAEQRVWKRLVGGDFERIDLSYVLKEEPGRTPAGSPPGGRLFGAPDIADYFCTLPSRRMVITGEAGAGKTVLALELIVNLIRPTHPRAPRSPDDPVPVRLSLSAWNTEAGLEDNLIDRLVKDFGLARRHARMLVERRRVLPVLDGLDEMDPTRANGRPDPNARRARAVLAALNDYQDGLRPGPVILTCRTTHYQALAGRRGAGQWLRDAAHIDIQPVNPSDAIAYLTARAADRSRWTPLLDTLCQNPKGELSRSLSTPWRLCLAATVYYERGDPAEMLGLRGTVRLDEHLMARYVPAVTRLHARPGYTPERVHRWLHHLTRHRTQDRPASDIVLGDLWPLAGPDRVGLLDVRLGCLFLALWLPLLLRVLGSAWFMGVSLFLVQFPILIYAMTRMLLGAHRKRLLPFPEERWWRIHVTAREGHRSLRLATIALIALADGLWRSAAAGPTRGIMASLGLALGLALGAYGVFFGLWGTPPRAASPHDVVNDDLAAHLACLLAAWSETGLLMLHIYGAAYILLLAYVFVFLDGSARGSPGRRYLAFILLSRKDGVLPLRLGAFLNWACEAGLMRLSGPAYQFRHLELRQWLAGHPAPFRAGHST